MLSYTIKYERAAKDDLAAAQDCYGAEFRQETTAWLQEIADAAERRDYPLSLASADLADALETVLESHRSSWPHSWQRWVRSSTMKKFRAILTLIRKRCPPWEIRSSERVFTVVNAFVAEVATVFEVDHVEKRVIFRMFQDLPGPGVAK